MLGSTPMVTSPKKKACFPSADCYFGGILGHMSAMFLCFLRNIQYFLMNFCRYYSDGHYTNKKIIKKNFRSCSSLLTSHFVLFLGPFWHMLLYFFFLRTIQYFTMERCTDVLGITLMVNTLFLTPCPSLLGGILGYFWAYFFMFLHFLRTVQYFIMKLCTHVLGSTLMITSPKNMSCSTLLEVRPFWGFFYFGLFWYIYVPLFLENCSIFSHKIL